MPRNSFFDVGDGLDEFFEAIGRVVVAANYMDDALGALYASMLGSDVGQLVASGQSFDTVLQACRAIQRSTAWHPDDVRLKAGLDTAKLLYEKRNQIAHGLWMGIAGADARASYRKRRWKDDADREDWTVVELRDLANTLGRAAWELFDLGQRA